MAAEETDRGLKRKLGKPPGLTVPAVVEMFKPENKMYVYDNPAGKKFSEDGYHEVVNPATALDAQLLYKTGGPGSPKRRSCFTYLREHKVGVQSPGIINSTINGLDRVFQMCHPGRAEKSKKGKIIGSEDHIKNTQLSLFSDTHSPDLKVIVLSLHLILCDKTRTGYNHWTHKRKNQG